MRVMSGMFTSALRYSRSKSRMSTRKTESGCRREAVPFIFTNWFSLSNNTLSATMRSQSYIMLLFRTYHRESPNTIIPGCISNIRFTGSCARLGLLNTNEDDQVPAKCGAVLSRHPKSRSIMLSARSMSKSNFVVSVNKPKRASAATWKRLSKLCTCSSNESISVVLFWILPE